MPKASDLADNSCAFLTPGESLLQAKGISCERGDKILFEGYDLAITSGEIVQLAGPNGAGKTTLLRAI